MSQDCPQLRFDAIPHWLVEWLETADQHQDLHTLALVVPEDARLTLTRSLKNYLSEFDSLCETSWRLFDRDLLQTLADQPSTRRIILAGEKHPEPFLWSETDRVIRRIASLGGAILEGPTCWQTTADFQNIFRILLHNGDHPHPGTKCHMSINMLEFPLHRLPVIIADSFLEWRSGEPARDVYQSR